jgi:hypothetical protein
MDKILMGITLKMFLARRVAFEMVKPMAFSFCGDGVKIGNH